jgi:hypothetical protein
MQRTMEKQRRTVKAAQRGVFAPKSRKTLIV